MTMLLTDAMEREIIEETRAVFKRYPPIMSAQEVAEVMGYHPNFIRANAATFGGVKDRESVSRSRALGRSGTRTRWLFPKPAVMAAYCSLMLAGGETSRAIGRSIASAIAAGPGRYAGPARTDKKGVSPVT